MKRTALAVLLLFLDLTLLQGQTMVWSCSQPPPLPSLSDLSQVSASSRMCGTSKAGIIAVGSGIAIGCTGMAFVIGNISGKGHSNTNGNNAHMGAVMFAIGGVLEIIGGGLMLGGGMHDHMQKRKISLLNSKNEIGLAYSFK